MRVKAENPRFKAVVLRGWTSLPLAQYRRVSARPALILGYLCALVLAVRSGWSILRVYKRDSSVSLLIWSGCKACAVLLLLACGKGKASFFFSLYVWYVGTGIRKAGVYQRLTPTNHLAPLPYIPECACFLAPPPPFCCEFRASSGEFLVLISLVCARTRGVWRRMVPPIPIGWSPSEFIN